MMLGRGGWGDVFYVNGFRVQEHVHSGRCRLLDYNGHRVMNGTFDSCVQAAEQQKQTTTTNNDAKIGVVLLHGVLRTSRCFYRLRKQLETNGYRAHLFDYPSTAISIGQAAQQLDRALESLRGLEQVHLVGHSMGGLVTRSWFGQFAAAHDHPPIGRVVMLGTPNQGAELADHLSRFPPYRWLFGGAGLELGTQSDPPPSLLAIPDVPFGIIAGGRGERTWGYNPFLPGDDDGTVTVARAHLAGEADFLRVPVMHRHLMLNPAAMTGVVNFLKTGQFGQ